MHPFILELCHVFHEWFQKHINIDVSLLQTLDKNRQHKILSVVTQPCRNVVHREDGWSYVVHGPIFTKWIHSIGTQSKPYISTLKAILDTEYQKFSTEFHPQGVESPHHFPYTSQNASSPVPHP
jgi:hypothetical protein